MTFGLKVFNPTDLLCLQQVNGEVEAKGVAPAAKAEDDSLPPEGGEIAPELQNGVKEEGDVAAASSPETSGKPKKEKKAKKKFSFRSISFSRKEKKTVAAKNGEVPKEEVSHECICVQISLFLLSSFGEHVIHCPCYTLVIYIIRIPHLCTCKSQCCHE